MRYILKMNLWDLQEDQRAEIVTLKDASHAGYLRRLKELGFVEGVQVRCLKRTPLAAPRVFEVPGGVYTLEKSAALLIEVTSKPVPSEKKS